MAAAPATRSTVRFLLNDKVVELENVRATTTLLDFLRLERSLTGTKEGCNEGDCGACTVLVGRLSDHGLIYQSLNACIRFLPSLDGCHVVSIEHLSTGGKLHPVQQAMIDYHGSQCGFCTPGIVMSLYALWMAKPHPSELEIETALQGNLCRCTGYEPIIKAAQAASKYGSPSDDLLNQEREAMTSQLAEWQDETMVTAEATGPFGDERFYIPMTVSQLASILEKEASPTIVAGATDVGLWVNKDHRSISPAVFIGNLNALQNIDISNDSITIGAGVTYSRFVPVLQEHLPHMAEMWWRIGGAQVRNMGTLGGNIANGSPIGDTPPAFIALGAAVTLRSSSGPRSVPLEDFFIEYGRQDRSKSEFVESLTIPIPRNVTRNGVYKISKRRDEDISAVCGAFHIELQDDNISACRIAFGGMAGTPKRASHVEAALVGQPWSTETIEKARLEFGRDYQPLSDWRGTSEYRILTAQNLLRRFFMENSNPGHAVRLERKVRSVEVAA